MGSMAKSGTSIKKGEVRNPKGPPIKADSMRQMFIGYFSSCNKGEKKTRLENIIKTLHDKAMDGDIIAAKYITDQCIGKPKETVDANLTGDVNITINKIVDE